MCSAVGVTGKVRAIYELRCKCNHQNTAIPSIELLVSFTFTFSHLADGLIQSDLQ